MRIYYQLLGVGKVSSAATNLKIDEPFHQFLKESISKIYEDPCLLKVKFLGVNENSPAPSDEDLTKVIQRELKQLSKLHHDFSLQDNIHAAKKKFAIEKVINIFEGLLK